MPDSVKVNEVVVEVPLWTITGGTDKKVNNLQVTVLCRLTLGTVKDLLLSRKFVTPVSVDQRA